MNRFENLDYVTKGLKPEKVFRYFEQLSQIPRGSGNEKEVSDYLYEFGKSLGLETIQDDVMNIIIKKPGTKGYEQAPVVILQGHMDMVCEKNEDTVHDFTKDPLKLYIDGNLLKAEGTTLGADNGIAVAYAMAILDSDDISHPPLEVIVTVEEETGMGGVIGFKKENVSGKLLINIDSEEEGVFFASCAGGVRANILLDIEKEANEMPCYKIMIKDLKGGHSGLNIKDGRGNAIKLLGRLLDGIDNYNLVEIFGGSKPNAIPREAYAVISTKDIEALKDKVKELEGVFNKELVQTDHLNIEVLPVDQEASCYSNELKERIIQTLLMIPCGVQTMSFAIEGLVESSLNIGVLAEREGSLVFESAIRSSVKSLKYEILNRIEVLSKLVRGHLETVSDYPEWAYNNKSMLQDLFKSVYKETTGKEAEIAAIHAGLECGFFAEKLTDTDGSDLDMISLGPNMANVHTPYEELDIESVERTWVFLQNVLKAIQ
ncbi:aminoacyl-histidine dipeptidase [Acidaminobacter sp. JC074]|uniref:aminoacyl-histidine dipeptidase n=1 Tax=Acidaminobacter sp. JC074 TaxID=2530199 RepID=UPI001F0F28F1|nr:aminoacyl-histidine dipeptidase [Acidaminobacter sp. JC074]MCH4888677.1 aminoacyl-histidine dipeptidase [Acidaminobacter sp. JC074]